MTSFGKEFKISVSMIASNRLKTDVEPTSETLCIKYSSENGQYTS
jgi:hypothetical protein